MSEFGRIATVLSMVLGLAVTRLLLGLVTAFRIRRTSRLDWVPMAWALILFLVQLQYWWAVNQLPTIRATFTFVDFLFLVLLTLALFLAAALILPSRAEDETGGLRVYFENDGRYALLAFSGFLVLAFIVNVGFFGSSPLSVWGITDIPMIVLPFVAFLAKSRTVYGGVTIVYLPLAAWDLWISVTS